METRKYHRIKSMSWHGMDRRLINLYSAQHADIYPLILTTANMMGNADCHQSQIDPFFNVTFSQIICIAAIFFFGPWKNDTTAEWWPKSYKLNFRLRIGRCQYHLSAAGLHVSDRSVYLLFIRNEIEYWNSAHSLSNATEGRNRSNNKKESSNGGSDIRDTSPQIKSGELCCHWACCEGVLVSHRFIRIIRHDKGQHLTCGAECKHARWTIMVAHIISSCENINSALDTVCCLSVMLFHIVGDVIVVVRRFFFLLIYCSARNEFGV